MKQQEKSSLGPLAKFFPWPLSFGMEVYTYMYSTSQKILYTYLKVCYNSLWRVEVYNGIVVR